MNPVNRIYAEGPAGDYGHYIVNGGKLDNGKYGYPIQIGLPLITPYLSMPIFTKDVADFLSCKTISIDAVAIRWNFDYENDEAVISKARTLENGEPEEMMVIAKNTDEKIELYSLDGAIQRTGPHVYNKNKYVIAYSDDFADYIKNSEHSSFYKIKAKENR